jgi:hypothetical protein
MTVTGEGSPNVSGRHAVNICAWSLEAVPPTQNSPGQSAGEDILDFQVAKLYPLCIIDARYTHIA